MRIKGNRQRFGRDAVETVRPEGVVISPTPPRRICDTAGSEQHEGCAMSNRSDKHRIVVMAALAAGFVASCNVVCAQVPCSYDIQIIASSNDCGGLGTVNTFGLGLNEHGDVVGYYFCPLWDHYEAFVWTAESGFVTLQRPQGVSSVIAVDVNDQGSICGTLLVSGVGYRGFLYDDGEWTILPPVVDAPGPWSGAAAINNVGVVVGYRSLTEDLNPRNAYVWSAKKGFTDLGVMSGPSSFARSISETRIVVGWAGNPSGSVADAFIWQDRKLRLLGPVPGGFTSQALGVNSVGAVSGAGRIQDEPDGPVSAIGFIWERGEFTLSDPILGYDTSSNSDINDQGYATGTSVNLDQPTDRHGYVWIDGVTHDLNELISAQSGVLIESTTGISARGEIVANGDDVEGEIAAFLLTPIAAPVGDLDGDCAVGVVDLLTLLWNWGACENCNECDADLDNNCVVGVSDLLILLGNWG